MKYAVIKIVNGNYAIAVETSDAQQATVNFHDLCKTLWNASDVKEAVVVVVDQSFASLRKETISHSAEVTE